MHLPKLTLFSISLVAAHVSANSIEPVADLDRKSAAILSPLDEDSPGLWINVRCLLDCSDRVCLGTRKCVEECIKAYGETTCLQSRCYDHGDSDPSMGRCYCTCGFPPKD
ncbi:hypothetical protein NpPPO83_00004327 [Neofusicoccum parvum]|uniref:Uncharacterized protein n=1 Tax=Neofusicoccum parvum TaxID=310453 RepID=A0ACB5S8D4_9PEZI|nr:hypothetical protein NpPPO83_00004327 [Neofusicoccum parvum]